MARENQGLQITLIVFVMLTIVLGVMTYLFYRRYEEAAIKAKTNADNASRQAAQASLSEENANRLKRLIGVAKTEDVDSIKVLFDKDMEDYGQSYPEEARKYRLLLEKMLRTIEEKNAELSDAKDKILRLDDKYAVREKNKDPQIKQFQDASVKANRDLADVRSKFKGEVERKDEDGNRLHKVLQDAREDAAFQIAKAETELKQTEEKVNKRGSIIDTQAEIIRNYEKGKIDAPDGEVLWANQREGTVWINLGRADTLKRQVTFSVYPSDNTNLTVDDKKGSIEITHILGEHLAEARVLDDQIGDPIVPGDKIHTVLWNAGTKRHFALAGLIDINGDGLSDLDLVMNIIRINGGVVDCYISDKGDNKHKMVGKITVNTNALIQGEAPTDKDGPAQLAAFTKIQEDAELLRTPKIQLGDLLQNMGWKNLSPVVRYGRGANSNDFRAKPAGGVPRKSTGNVSDLYQKRNPPKKSSSGGRYYRF